MKRFWVVVALMVVAGQASADNGIRWVTEQVQWSIAGVPTDAKSMTAVDDTVRTVEVSTANWAWDALFQNGTSVMPGVTVHFTTTASSADTVYYGVELGMGGGNPASGSGATVWQRCDPFDMASAGALGMAATGSNLSTGANGNGQYFTGPLYWDPNTFGGVITNNIWLKPKFRLMIRNNHVGSANLTNLRCYITFPKRVSGGVTWNAVKLDWNRSGTVKDTVNIASASDTAQTVGRNLGDAAWQVFSQHSQATTPMSAFILFTATSATTVDSVYYAVNTGAKGKWMRMNPLGPAAAVTSCASGTATSSTTSTGNGRFFVGQITTEPDAYAGVNNNLYGKSDVRITVKPATGATLTGLRCWLVYPRFVQ